jgi:hypothetical protein
MSLTNQSVIDKALAKGGVIEESASASTVDTATALSVLNQMMTQWREADMDLNWFEQTDAAETCPIPDYAELAVISQLAIECSTSLRYPVTAAMFEQAKDAVNVLAVVLINEQLTNTDMSHLPRGRSRYWDIESGGYR